MHVTGAGQVDLMFTWRFDCVGRICIICHLHKVWWVYKWLYWGSRCSSACQALKILSSIECKEVLVHQSWYDLADFAFSVSWSCWTLAFRSVFSHITGNVDFSKHWYRSCEGWWVGIDWHGAESLEGHMCTLLWWVMLLQSWPLFHWIHFKLHGVSCQCCALAGSPKVAEAYWVPLSVCRISDTLCLKNFLSLLMTALVPVPDAWNLFLNHIL